MLIILEGMDHSGKTSLQNFLKNHYNKWYDVSTFHSERGLDHFDRLQQIQIVTKQPQNLVISDRIGIIGEEVYGKNLRGKSVFEEFGYTFEQTWKIFIMGTGKSPIIFIFCNPNTDNKSDKEEMEGVVENWDKLKEAYLSAIQRTKVILENFDRVRYLEYDYTSDSDYNRILKQLGGIL